MPVNKLPTYKGYTVDFKLKHFRKMLPDKKFAITKIVPFAAPDGDEMLAEMIEKGLVPKETLKELF